MIPIYFYVNLGEQYVFIQNIRTLDESITKLYSVRTLFVIPFSNGTSFIQCIIK